MQTTNSVYGNQGENLELKNNFTEIEKLNRLQDKSILPVDIIPCDRHLPKDYKKKKMDPSIIDDPYDELKDLFKKGKKGK